MRYSKKALAFIGAVLLLFQAGCSSPKQEEENWETVIECQYEDMGISPNQQFLIAKKDGLYGAYVKNGDSYELKIPFQYEKIAFDPYADANLFCSRQDGRVEIYGKNGEKLTDETFQELVYPSSPEDIGFAVSTGDSAWGYLSRDGKWIFKPHYDKILSLHDGTYLLESKDADGKLLSDWVDETGTSLLPSKDIIAVSEDSLAGYISVTLNRENPTVDWKLLHGIVGKDGKYVVPPIYKFISVEQDDAGQVYFHCITGDGERFMLDSNGETLFQYEGNGTLLAKGNGLFQVSEEDRCGVLSSSGEWILPAIYDSAEVGIYVLKASDEEGEWLFDLEGNKLSDQPYDRISIAGRNMSEPIPVYKKDKVGFISGDHTVSIPLQYDTFISQKEDTLLVKKGDRYGLINRKNETLIDFVYDELTPFNTEEYAYAVKGGKAGIIDIKGDTAVPFIFDIPEYLGDRLCKDMAVVKQNGTYGCIRLLKIE